MAKKRAMVEPVIDSLIESFSGLITAIICHAITTGGAESAINVLEVLKCQIQTQSEELQEAHREQQEAQQRQSASHQ